MSNHTTVTEVPITDARKCIDRLWRYLDKEQDAPVTERSAVAALWELSRFVAWHEAQAREAEAEILEAVAV